MQYVEAIRRQVVLRLVSGVAECCFFVCRIVVGTSYRIAASAARCVSYYCTDGEERFECSRLPRQDKNSRESVNESINRANPRTSFSRATTSHSETIVSILNTSSSSRKASSKYPNGKTDQSELASSAKHAFKSNAEDGALTLSSSVGESLSGQTKQRQTKQ
jgi:hypothetical protein